MSIAARVLVLSLLALIPSCAAALVGAGVAVGAWAYDENADDGGTIVLPHRPEVVFRVAEQVARERGSEIVAVPASRRIECTVDGTSVRIQALEIMDKPDVCELKVRARTLWRGRADLAEDLALAIQNRLG